MGNRLEESEGAFMYQGLPDHDEMRKSTPCPGDAAPLCAGGQPAWGMCAYCLEAEADMSAAGDLRSLMEAAGRPFRFRDLYIKAAAMAAREHPAVNASWTGEGVRRHGPVHVWFAAAVAHGPATPAVRDADRKSLAQVAAEASSLMDRAVRGGLSAGDVQGGSIAVVDLGMYPLTRCQAALRPPESCVLAFGALRQQPVWRNGAHAARPVVSVTASFDQRVVEETVGAGFLTSVKRYLENPILTLL